MLRKSRDTSDMYCGFFLSLFQRNGCENYNLKMLPAEFDRQIYLAVAQKLNIQPKTAEKQIGRFAKTGLRNHFAHNKYRK